MTSFFFTFRFSWDLRKTYINDITTSGSISPLSESKYFLRSWSQCSKTKVNFLSEWRTSWSRTMFLCFSSFKRHISLRAEEGTPCKRKIRLIQIVRKKLTIYLIVIIKPDPLQRHNFLSFFVFSFKYCSISPWID